MLTLIDPRELTQLLNLQGVVADGHISLLNVVQLLAELKLACNCVFLFWCFGLSDVVEHVIMDA